jgi:hypothetical protein
MRVPGIVTEVIAELTTTYTMIVPPFRLASRTRTRRSCDSAKEGRGITATQPAGIFGQTNPQAGARRKLQPEVAGVSTRCRAKSNRGRRARRPPAELLDRLTEGQTMQTKNPSCVRRSLWCHWERTRRANKEGQSANRRLCF